MLYPEANGGELMRTIIPWVLTGGLIVFAGINLIITAIKAKLSRAWQLVLLIIGSLTIAAGGYWLLFLLGLAVP